MTTPSTTPDMERLFRVANGGMGLLFVYSMVVQHNDPDAANWIAAYGVAAVLCLSAVLGRPRWKLAALLCVVTAGAALFVAPGVPSGQGLVASEPGRELLGMVLVSAWMGLLTWWWRSGEEPPTPRSPPPSSP